MPVWKTRCPECGQHRRKYALVKKECLCFAHGIMNSHLHLQRHETKRTFCETCGRVTQIRCFIQDDTGRQAVVTVSHVQPTREITEYNKELWK